MARIQEMIDTVAEAGFVGYFVDEPTPLRDCFCPSCRARWFGGDLPTRTFVLAWSHWRGHHQAVARYHHYRRRLALTNQLQL